MLTEEKDMPQVLLLLLWIEEEFEGESEKGQEEDPFPIFFVHFRGHIIT